MQSCYIQTSTSRGDVMLCTMLLLLGVLVSRLDTVTCATEPAGLWLKDTIAGAVETKF